MMIETEVPPLSTGLIKYEEPQPTEVGNDCLVERCNDLLWRDRSEGLRWDDENASIVDMIEGYQKRFADLKYEHEGMIRFINSVCRDVNGFTGAWSAPWRSTYEARAETLALPRDQAISVLRQSIIGIAEWVIRDLFWTCHFNLQKQQVGLIQWMSDSVCRYFHFNYEKNTRNIGVTDNAFATVNHMEKVETHVLNVHDLVEAKSEPFKEYTGFVPPRIMDVLNSAPRWAQPVIEIVSGHEVYESVARREVARTTWDNVIPKPIVIQAPRLTYDPCVCIGPYVLCGWK